MQNIAKRAGLFIGLLVCAACTTTYTDITTDGVSYIDSKAGGAIVYNAQNSIDCSNMWVTFEDVESGKSFETLTSVTDADLPYEGSELAYVWVPAGAYRIEDAKCDSLLLVGFKQAFSGIEISAGDLVYIGTFDLAKRSLGGGRQSFSNRVPLTYSLLDNSDAILEHIKDRFPNLEDNLKVGLVD